MIEYFYELFTGLDYSAVTDLDSNLMMILSFAFCGYCLLVLMKIVKFFFGVTRRW